MRALKLLVVSLGVLLVSGMVALAVAVTDRIEHPRAASVPPAAATQEVDLPSGAKILGSDVSGDRLVVRIGQADGSEEFLMFNLATGQRVTTIRVRPSP